MQARTRVPEGLLLVVALVGPVFYLMGLVARRLSLLYGAYTRLGILYGVLALSAAVAACLALRSREPWAKAAATLALLANLASISFVGMWWSRDVNSAIVEARMAPIAGGKLGIVVSPADSSSEARDDARAFEARLQAYFSEVGLAPSVTIRRSYPVSSEDQARRLGEKLGAQFIVWSRQAEAAGSNITICGASEADIEAEPLSLMLFMSTQHTLVLDGTFAPGLASPSNRLAAPLVGAFGALALGQPVLASAEFQALIAAADIPSSTVRALHNYRGVALLYADRPDLAADEFLAAMGPGPWAAPSDAFAWVGIGNVFLARRDYQSAADAYSRALAVDPYGALPYCGVGICYLRDRNVTRAVSAFRQAIALEPAWGGPHALMGLTYETIGNISGAREEFQTCALLSGPCYGIQSVVRQRAEDIARNPPSPIPTATVPPKPTPTPFPTSAIYQVKRGDTLQGVAAKFGVPPELIIELNQLESPESLRIGQMLAIPAKK